MVAQSKLVSDTRALSYFAAVPYTCYELGHTWDPSCLRSFLHAFKDAFLRALQLYIPFYLVTSLPKLNRKERRTKKELQRVIIRILQSSLFLSMQGAGSIGGFCLLRHILRRFYGWHALVIGFVLGYVGLDVETKSRKGLIAFTSSILAAETLFAMAVSRRWITPIHNGEVILFCFCSACFMAFHRASRWFPNQGSLQIFLGSKEGVEKEHDFILEKTSHFLQRCPDFLCRVYSKLKRCHSPHPTCVHENSCAYYAFEGFCRNFAIGAVADILLKLLQGYRRKAGQLKYNFSSMSLFFASYSALFRACNCLLRWIRNKDSPAIHGALSGALAGVSSYFYKSSIISMYFFLKIVEVLVHKGVDEKVLPHWSKGNNVLYATSVSILLNAAFLEPHNMPPRIWKLLCELSNGRFHFLFRKLLDVYGTNSSAIHPHFVPALDHRFVTTPKVIEVLSAHNKLT